MSRVINFKFKADFKGSPVSELNGKTILLDKHSAITPKVKIGESWDCQFLFERDTFAVFKPIRKTADADPDEQKAVEQESKNFYQEEFPPSPHQQAIYNEIQHGMSNLMVNAVAGSGKCHTKGTKILMYDGSIKNVENIKVGDYLMGDDGTNRKVLSLARGKEECYNIIPIKGVPFGVNKSHILVLRASYTWRKKYVKNQIVEISFEDWLNLPNDDKHCLKLFRTGFESCDKIIPKIDPYFIGLWIGDGITSKPNILVNEKYDIELVHHLKELSNDIGLNINRKKQRNSGDHVYNYGLVSEIGSTHNPISCYLKEMDLFYDKNNIPNSFIKFSIKDRKKLIAGFIDSDGYKNGNGLYDVIGKRKNMMEIMALLCRSVGYSVKESIKEVKWSGNAKNYIRKSDNENRKNATRKYYRLSISGANDLPCLIKRKKSTKRIQKKNHSNTGFSYEEMGLQDYYGFEISGNGRYLLSDTIVTHNTSTLLGALRRVPKTKTIKFLAFNRSIVEELRKKVPKTLVNVDISTVHGFGMKALNMKFKCEVKADKYREIAKTISVDWDIPDGVDKEDYIRRVVKLCDLGRLNLCKYKSELEDLSVKHDIELTNGECGYAIELIRIGLRDTKHVDYTDMIYFPNIMNLTVKQYDLVFIDEAQDLNACQRELMLKAVKPDGGKFVAVGDPHQCQPKGTMILMANGIEKPIEKLVKGDMVVTYNSKSKGSYVGFSPISNSSYSKGRRVNKIGKREYNGDLYEVYTDYGRSLYTPNHKCIVRFNDKIDYKNKYVLYMMKKGSKYRIGITSFFSGYGLGVSIRARQEKADSFWILSVYNSKKEAELYERFYSLKSGIPQMTFISSNKSKYTQEDIDDFYSMFVGFDDETLEDNAKILLSYFHRDIKYPFHTKEISRTGGRYKSFKIYACNILMKYMVAGHADNNSYSIKGRRGRKDYKVYHPLWKEITSIRKTQYKGYVYSLDVDVDHNYIADGILTSNSIYGFAGADLESWDKLKSQPNTKELPLSVCYRCDTAMIEKAKIIVPQIEARDGAPEGIVDNNASVKDIRDGDMILCRNTFPLVRLCISYLANGIKAYIMGRDIGANLINMVRNTRETFVVGVFKKLNRELKKIESNICTKRDMIPREARETMTYQSFKEKIDVIETLSKGLDKASEVIDKIDKIFSDDDSEGIILSTIHKAKGLEKDKVFIIHEDLMPSKWCLEIDWMLEQEYNLMYVAYTRAKHYLGFVQDYDAYGSKDIDLVDKGKIKDDWNNKDKD